MIIFSFIYLFSFKQKIPKFSVLSGTNRTKIIPEPFDIKYYNRNKWVIPDDLVICKTGNEIPLTTLSLYADIFFKYTKKRPIIKKCTNLKSLSNQVIFFKSTKAELPNEGYEIIIKYNKGVRVSASSPSGFFYSAMTLDQIIEEEEEDGVFSIQDMKITDFPRFRYRGLMLDVGRHFFNSTTIKELLHQMAKYKLNVFHWHLTEDQGWRIEIKKYPQLTIKGATRAASPVKFHRLTLDNQIYGPFYFTQDQVREIIDYAKLLQIEIIPEIELPGHALSALSAYPQFSCTGGPFEPKCLWGVEEEVYCAGNDGTLRFLEDILDEICDLFESKYIHIGGDECPKDRWRDCPKCQKRMKDNNLRDEDELQSWITKHFEAYLSKKGKRIIGWDEILQGGVAESAVVMTWRGFEIGQRAASEGHDVIMTPVSHMYFDFYQSSHDPYEYIGGFLSTRKVYSFNPTEGIEKEKEKHVLGTQANLWTEYIHTRDELMWKTFPRLCAMSEVAWSALEKKSWDVFQNKLKYLHYQRLKDDAITLAPIQLLPVAEWECNPSSQWTTLKWNINITCPIVGNYQVDFLLNKGGPAQVKNVRVYDEGNIVGFQNDLQNIDEDINSNARFIVQVTSKEKWHNMELSAEFMCKEKSNGEFFMDFFIEDPGV